MTKKQPWDRVDNPNGMDKLDVGSLMVKANAEALVQLPPLRPFNPHLVAQRPSSSFCMHKYGYIALEG